jgi:large subunit ribosomal protein L25
MEKVLINASTRTVTGKKVGILRREGMLPGVLYGHNFTSTPIVMNLKEATKALSSVTESSIVNVRVDGKDNATLVREKQRDFIRGTLRHVDFQVISLTERLRARVSIELTGVSPAVKNFNGLVLAGINDLEVECLPEYLPEKILVDISILEQIGSAIHVSDLSLDSHISILTRSDEQVVHIVMQKVEEEAVAEVVEAAEAEPEVIEKGKKEEELPE